MMFRRHPAPTTASTAINVIAEPARQKAKRVAYWLLVFVPIFTYAAKYALLSVLNQAGAGFMLLALAIALIALLVLLVSEIRLIIYGIRYKDALPAIGALLLFYIFAWYIPLLPLIPNNVQRHFSEHRAEYEQILAQASSGSLPDDAPFGARILHQTPLVVSFHPNETTWFNGLYIIYSSERPYNQYGCYLGASSQNQLDESWWICSEFD